MIHLVSVAFGGEETLGRTLPTWSDALGGSGWQVSIWDNSSLPSAAGELVRAHLPNASVHGDGENHGFAGGINRLIRDLNADDVVVLLNLDVTMTRDWVAEVTEFSGRGVLGAVPLVTNRRHHCGISVDRVLNFRDAEMGAPIAGPSGGGAIIPIRVFTDVGPFNESYFAWGEDAEWAMRATKRGHTTEALTTALAHEGRHSVTSAERRNHRAFLLARNRVWFWKEFSSSLAHRMMLLVPWIGSALVIAARGLRDHTVRARVRGLWTGLTQ